MMVFISYSWDSEEHKKRVEDFVNKLLSDGVSAIWDRNMRLGERFSQFMENNIVSCEYVLFICTPDYKKKADSRKGGVGYESNIITGELYYKYNECKYIPILFEGTWESALPNWAIGKLGIDLSGFDYEKEYEKLLNQIANNEKEHKETEINMDYINIKSELKSLVLKFKKSLVFLSSSINNSKQNDIYRYTNEVHDSLYKINAIRLTYNFAYLYNCQLLENIISKWNEFVVVYNVIADSKNESPPNVFEEANGIYKEILTSCDEFLTS